MLGENCKQAEANEVSHALCAAWWSGWQAGSTVAGKQDPQQLASGLHNIWQCNGQLLPRVAAQLRHCSTSASDKRQGVATCGVYRGNGRRRQFAHTWFLMKVASESAYAPVMWCLLRSGTRARAGQSCSVSEPALHHRQLKKTQVGTLVRSTAQPAGCNPSPCWPSLLMG